MKKTTVHLICNAHLDPVWQWRWEEGCSEALATFRNAARMLAEHDSLIFNHNEALLYQWVERYDPPLFDTIRRLVQGGRWCISGGWYLQPDANMPGLESFIRHMALGGRYFLDRFNARPKAAYNFDSFGHHGGMPQLLRLFGFAMYIHMRPQAHEMDLPSDLYRWRGVEGTEVLALRISPGLYHSERDNIEERLAEGVDTALREGRDAAVFWGLGNHGGGATRQDLRRIDAFIRKEDRVLFRHSTPDLLYEALKGHAPRAPLVEGDLQRTFTGCYTSLSRIKRRAQKSLALLVQAEALSTAAWWIFGKDYPREALEDAWQDHLLNDFHDILPGTCTEPAERDALDLYGRAAQTARRIRLEAAATFNQNIKGESDLPLSLFNHNPTLAKIPVEAEFMSDYRPFWNRVVHMRLFSEEGQKIPCQEEQPEALLPFNWRRKICFMAEVPSLGAAHYRLEAVEGKVKDPDPAPPALACELDASTGFVKQVRDGINRPFLSGPLFVPLVVRDEGDAWGTGCSSYREIEGRFLPRKEEVRVIERGPIRSILESIHCYHSSRIKMHVVTYASWPVIEVRLKLFWSERRSRLKLSVPTAFMDGAVECEIPGGTIARPPDGDEHVHGRWIMVKDASAQGEERALGIVHGGMHGFSFEKGELRLSVLRSAAFCHERGFDLSGREYEYMDQGIHETVLLVAAGTAEDLRVTLPSLADWLDAPPKAYAHLPLGGIVGRKDNPGSLLEIAPQGIRMTACKRSEDGEALIIRLHEIAGKGGYFRIRVLHGEGEVRRKFKPFEIQTLRFEKDGTCRDADPMT